MADDTTATTDDGSEAWWVANQIGAAANVPTGYTTDPDIESLLIFGNAKLAAYQLRAKFDKALIDFTSGFRDLEDQVHAMAKNSSEDQSYLTCYSGSPQTKAAPDGVWASNAPTGYSNKKTLWKKFSAPPIQQMYYWVWTNPTDAKDFQKTYAQFKTIANNASPADQAKMSLHCAGRAFDVQPLKGKSQQAKAKEIVDFIAKESKAGSGSYDTPGGGNFAGFQRMLTKEGKDLVRWHVQFLPTASDPTYAQLLEWKKRRTSKQPTKKTSRSKAKAVPPPLLPDYVFVLSFENRSFDHLFGFSNLQGPDAVSGKVRRVNGVLNADGSIKDGMTNTYDDGTGPVTCQVSTANTPWRMPGDPGHEFENVLAQVCGRDAAKKEVTKQIGTAAANKAIFVRGGQISHWTEGTVSKVEDDVEAVFGKKSSSAPDGVETPVNPITYPARDASGYVTSWVESYVPQDTKTLGTLQKSKADGTTDYDYPMRCFDTPTQLPVFYNLAQNYALCDNYFASLPGPTCPNRLFMMAASSGGLDHSPSTSETIDWAKLSHIDLPNGHIFDRVEAKAGSGKGWRVISDKGPPMCGILKGVTKVASMDDLAKDLDPSKTTYPYQFTWIEPFYDAVTMLHKTFADGNSMHPASDVREAEKLLAQVYGLIRSNPNIWNRCALFILWDEHGGFYDHVPSPAAPIPPDRPNWTSGYTQFGFQFDSFGTRIPALVVSPLVGKGVLDGRQYDHSSFIKTITELGQQWYGNKLSGISRDMDPATSSMTSIFSQSAARADADCPTADQLNSVGTASLQASTSDGVSSEVDGTAAISGNTPTFLLAGRNLQSGGSDSSSITTLADASNFLTGVTNSLFGTDDTGEPTTAAA